MSTPSARVDPLTRPAVVLGLAVAAILGDTVATILMAESTTLVDPTAAAVRGSTLAGAHIVAALYLWWRRPASRFPALLLLVALTFTVYGLAAVDAPWPYLIGRAATFAALPLAAYVFLAFPSGHLQDRASIAVVLTLVVLVALGWLAFSIAGPVIPTTIPSLSCGDACPPSPLAVGDGPHADVALTRVIFTAASAATLWIFGVLLLRVRRTPPGRRVAMALVAAVAGINAVLLATWLMVAAFADASPPAPLGTALGLARFGLPIVLTIAVILDQGRSAQALRTLLETMAPGGGLGDLRVALAGVLRDPGLVIARRRGGGWEDLEGVPVEPPRDGDGRTWTEVAGPDGAPAIALMHAPSLGESADMVDAAAAAAAIAVREQDLADGLRRAVDELRASRARLATAADEERRRLERDLHDSAQQALVALRVRVAVTRETLDGDTAAAVRALDDIDGELGLVLDDLRRLSRGLYPPLLEDRGLLDALRGTASRAPLPVTVEGDIGRLPRHVEVAAYFCCSEALQNAGKHAGRGASATVSLSVTDGALLFEVVDDGAGFDATATPGGTGLTGMRDRAGAVGGRLEVSSSPAGTRVSGRLPLEAPSA